MKKYRYNRADFKPLPVKLEHMDIHLNFINGKVNGTNKLRIKALRSVGSVRLDAQDLEIHSIKCSGRNLKFTYQRKTNALVVKLPRKAQPGSVFTIETDTTCTPTDNILEGIYKDTTPPGCPQQYMSQCQQWGFQRILPVIDDCTAKCTMKTTIEADARYTHLISNGNVSRKQNPDGKPVLKKRDPSRQVITYENRIPMAPYLFIICVGTWDVLEDEVVYQSGRKVKLEYLVPPGRKNGAVVPMMILKDSVEWHGRTQDYEYEREAYRTICMEKSNFGGMENVGNTTIVTDAAMVDEFTGDGRIDYCYRVIIHEFEHNQCGSDVTMETPFDMWLNEAYTVDVERQYHVTRFDPDCSRLSEVDSVRAPISGPLAVEDAGHLGNIVREGFNHPDELVDGLTYVKAAEVINMLRLILGQEVFRSAKNFYFDEFKGGNANTDQFFSCFEKVSGRDLAQFKREWLYTIGYPTVEATYRYDNEQKMLHVFLRQTRTGPAKQPMGVGGGLFHLPFEMAAVDENGNDIPGASGVFEMTGREPDTYCPGKSSLLHLTFANVPEPAFLSLNRNCSFYGTFVDKSVTREQLLKQIRLDPNRFNRVEAMRQLTDIERVKLIKDINAPVSREWLDTYAALLSDMSLSAGLKGYLLRIDEQSVDRTYLPYYRERYAARIKLMKTVAENCMGDLLRAYHAVDTYKPAVEPRDGIEERGLKSVLLRTIVEAETPEVYALAEEHFRKAWNVSDKMAALGAINSCNHPRRQELMEEGFNLWKDHLSAYSGYLTLVSGSPHDDVFERIAHEAARVPFTIEHPTHTRALLVRMAWNNKMLWTDAGIEWVADMVIKLAPVNEHASILLLACFQQVHDLADDLKPKVVAALKRMKKSVDAAKHPSVAGRIAAYLGK